MKAEDLTGQRFGSLVVERMRVDPRPGRVWLCRCDCGGETVRSTTNLRAVVRVGGSPSCVVCNRAAKSRRALDMNGQRRERISTMVFRAMWKACGALYGPGSTEGMQRDIIDDLEVELGVRPDPDRTVATQWVQKGWAA